MSGERAADGDRRWRRAGATVLSLAALAPLVYVPGLMYPYVVPKALAVRIGVGVGAAVLVWMVGTRRVTSVDSADPVLWSLVSLTAVSAVAGMAGSSPHHSLLGDFGRMWGVAHWGYLTLLYVLLRSFLDDAAWRLLLRVTLAVAVAVAVCSLFESWVEHIYPSFSGQGTVGTLGNRGFLGGYTLLAAGLCAVVAARGGESSPVRLGAAACVLLFGIVLLLSGNRAGMVGALAGGALAVGLWAWPRGDRRKSPAKWILGGVAAAATLFGLGWLLAPGAVMEIPLVARVASFDPATGTVMQRIGAWGAAVEGLAERPLAGWGPENFELVYDRFADPAVHRVNNPGRFTWDRAHNVLLGRLVESGPLGLAAYLSLWGSIGAVGVRAWRAERLTTLEASGLLVALAGYFVYLQFWFEDHSTAVVLVTLAAYLRHRGTRRPLLSLEPAGRPDRRRAVLWGTAALGVLSVVLWLNVRTGVAALHMGRANAAPELRESVRHYEDARQLGVPEQRSVALEYASSMADLGLQSGAGLRDSDSLRALYSRGVEGADRALTPVEERNPLDARVDASRGRLAAGAAVVFAGEGIQELARESLRRSIDKSPALLEHRHTLASVEALFGNLEGAREVLREALDLYDGYGRTHYLMSQMSGSPGDSAALHWLRRSFWLDYYPEEKAYLRRTVSSLLERGDPGEAESLLSDYVASRYLPALRERGDVFAAERREFLRGRTADVTPIGREDRPYVIARHDMPLLAMWPRAAVAAGECDRATLAGRILLNGLSEEQRTASLRPTLARQVARLDDRCREAG